jgi:hypothetical protein
MSGGSTQVVSPDDDCKNCFPKGQLKQPDGEKPSRKPKPAQTTARFMVPMPMASASTTAIAGLVVLHFLFVSSWHF